MPEDPPPSAIRTGPPEVRAVSLSKDFGGPAVLDDINFEVLRGQIVAIVGGSGSGKTVLLHLLAGLMPASRGRVLVADHSQEGSPLVDLNAVDEDRRDEVRMHWAVVFQKNALFSGSVRDNVALLLREHTDLSESQIEARVRESLAAAALDVENVIGKDRDELSGGMAKRVAIARAIAIDPAVVFYDEPTTGLDPVISAHIHELVWTTHLRPRAGEPRTTIVVTHDKDLLRRLRPRVIMLLGGKVCFEGDYASFARAEDGPPHEYLRAMPVLHAKRVE